jgi:hypothetical protein
MSSSNTAAAPWTATLSFRGQWCCLSELTFSKSNELVVDLFAYAHKMYTIAGSIVRFDPDLYPTEGGFPGNGGKTLLTDLQTASKTQPGA